MFHVPSSHRLRTSVVCSLRGHALAAALSLSIACLPGPGAALTVDLGTPLSVLQQQERTVEDLFRDATPSIVYINTFVAATDRITMNAVEVPSGAGSGVIWDEDGHVVTNYHVIKGANAARVAVTENGRSTLYDASLVGYNPDKDVAVLSLDRSSAPRAKLRPIPLGESSSLRVGQTALAIGNPFGLDHSLTVGVVSGLGREMRAPSGRPITNVIQTDAAINPGNSGGALLDSSGRLVGMNTAIYSPSGASAGIGFAIPVDTLKQQVELLLKSGRVMRPTIGVVYAQGAQASSLGVQEGVLVLSVPKPSPAADAGLRGTYRDSDGSIVLGDVIVGLQEDVIKSDYDLFKALDKCNPGQTVSLTVERTPTSLREEMISSQPRQRVQLKVKLEARAAV
ncbi:hypothetical protein AB1Y20_005693 [Prymnesium parvum]